MACSTCRNGRNSSRLRNCRCRYEEQAAQALDRLRLLEAEIGYYICHSKPLASLDPQRINRLIQLAKQPGLNRQAV